jgi:DNA-binding transcriptional LysR family regulator
LLDCGVAVFDDLRRGVQQIEFLSDPTSGEVRIGTYDVMMAGLIPSVIDSLARKHPRMSFHTFQGDDPHFLRTTLRERKVDLIISRRMPEAEEEDLIKEPLFRDPMLVVAGPGSRWISRRKIALSELLDEPWIVPLAETTIGKLVAQSFHSIGLEQPRGTVRSNSSLLRNRLLATGRYLGVLPRSMLQFDTQLPAKILPVELPDIVQPVELLTLKNRLLSPAVNLFIECTREVASSVGGKPSRLRPASKREVAKSFAGRK